MDTKISALALALFLALGLGIVLLACLFVTSFPNSSGNMRSQLSAQFSGAENSTKKRRLIPANRQSSRRDDASANSLRRIAQLEASLARQTQLLRSTSARLEKTENENKTLRTERDEYLEMLTALEASGQRNGGGSSDERNGGSDDVASTDFQRQIELLENQIAEGEMMERMLQAEIAQLRSRLNQAFSEIASQELAGLLDEDNSIPTVSSEVIVQIGSAAVPMLVERLSDRRANVRAWAATVLGELGPDAGEAASALRIALSDSNQQVRTAAGRALNSILD